MSSRRLPLSEQCSPIYQYGAVFSGAIYADPEYKSQTVSDVIPTAMPDSYLEGARIG
jgi:hypothetical protein